MAEFQSRVYKGWVIDRSLPSGMYSAWRSTDGRRVRADTLAGIKEYVRDIEAGKA